MNFRLEKNKVKYVQKKQKRTKNFDKQMLKFLVKFYNNSYMSLHELIKMVIEDLIQKKSKKKNPSFFLMKWI